jgi:hypothetical protein
MTLPWPIEAKMATKTRQRIALDIVLVFLKPSSVEMSVMD